jgi:hypothetical protein
MKTQIGQLAERFENAASYAGFALTAGSHRHGHGPQALVLVGVILLVLLWRHT